MEDFIIVYSKVEVKNMPDRREWVWEKYFTPEDGEQITAIEALEIIEENELVVVHSESDGKIYDREDEPFKTRYKGYFEQKDAEERSLIERIKAAIRDGGKKVAEKTKAARMSKKELIRRTLETQLKEEI